jgi:hypothetical protein
MTSKTETMTTATLTQNVEAALTEFEALRARIGEVADARGELLDYGEIDAYIEAVRKGLSVAEQKLLAEAAGLNVVGLRTGRQFRFEIDWRLRRCLESYQRTRF